MILTIEQALKVIERDRDLANTLLPGWTHQCDPAYQAWYLTTLSLSSLPNSYKLRLVDALIQEDDEPISG